MHPDYQGFAYSDGDDAELRIYEGLRSSRDTSCQSEDLQRLIVDWPTEYHFSRVRYNLLRHIPFKPGDRILELGAGCGSITRQLGETGADVTAIEGSHNRARCARERCRDLSNVSIFCSNFQDIEHDSQFDFVTLIGVLEYSPLFIDSQDPFVDCLRMARGALKPGGHLLIAIENQLGLKYFSGITEDHLAVPYVGIEDRYQAKGVRTLGQAELRRKIIDAGFLHTEFQYPFPDYKLPRYILFEEAFSDPEFMPEEIIRHLRARDYSGRGNEEIDLALVWPVVTRNGLTQALSNSFLAIAACHSDCTFAQRPGLLAVGYAMERSARYCTATFFERMRETIEVKKSSQLSHDPGYAEPLSQTLGVEQYKSGITLHSKLYSCAKRGDFDGVIDCLRTWIEFLGGIPQTQIAAPEWEHLLPPKYIDCLPTNLVLTNSGLEFVDREWTYSKAFSVGSLALRYLTVLIEEDYFTKLLQGQGITDQAAGIRTILQRLNLHPSADAYRSYIELHRDIDRQVFPWRPSYQSAALEQALTNRELVHLGTDESPQASHHKVADIARRTLRSLRIW